LARQEFENQTLISAVTSKKIEVISGESNTLLPAGQSEIITFFSPPNTVTRVLNIALEWHSEQNGSLNSGTKNLIVNSMSIGVVNMASAWNKYLAYDVGQFSADTLSYTPNNLASATQQIRSLVFDDTREMALIFNHNFNLAVSSKRTWKIIVERETVKR
jgi:hypothetical protein